MPNTQRIQLTFIFLFLFTINISAAAQITSPEENFGYEVGADHKLTSYKEAIQYFELISRQSDRMILLDMGETSMGNRMKYTLISSERNVSSYKRYKMMAERLSLARGVSEEEAEWLTDNGKAIAWIDVGLHATECAPSQHAIQLAYDLITGEDQVTRNIRENVITILVFANPDGMDMISEWYMNNVGTEFETSRMPWLYHKYIGHDNNRDSFNVSQVETQNITRLQNHEWFPNVVYNHHQTSPFPTRIWIPPYGEPTNPNKPAMVIRWENLIGAAMGKAFDEADQPGAVSRISFDAWYPGFMTQVVTTHNIPSILTETALYRYATPREYKIDDFPEAYRELTKSAFYPNPWKGGWWRLRDAVDYCLTASKAVLDVCARYRKDMLYSKYKMASDNIEKFLNDPPYGWVIPADQRDRTTTGKMLEKLQLLGIEIFRAEESFNSSGREFPEGTYVIPASQPFAMFVKTMMEKQDYPDLRKFTHLWQGVPGRVRMDSKDPLRPYDVAGWTLPVQMGVEYYELDSPVRFRTVKSGDQLYPEGGISGRRGDYVFSAADNNAFTAVNKLFSAGARVKRAEEGFEVEETVFPAGSFIVDNIDRQDMIDISTETHISITRSNTKTESMEIEKAKIGHYKSWTASMDEGWIRWILEQYEFDYSSLLDKDIRAGNLNDRYNVIIIPDLRINSIVNGHKPGTIPADYAGGIGDAGVENIKEFVNEGGTLICNNNSCDFGIQYFHLPVKNILQGVKPSEFYSAGSILKMNYDVTHPTAFGMQQDGIIFFSRARVFEVNDSEASAESIRIISRFPETPLLVSGYIENDEKIQGKPAALEIPYGKGRIILFGFNFHNRAQSYSTFKLLFNCLYK
ncbi:MAG: hypothetical protein GY863_21190 [bacterium]|nr:hypothetical protein [bacterium]